MKKNKNITLLIVIIIFLIIILLGCEKEIEEIKVNLYPAYELDGNNKFWGYIDKEGKFIVEPIYDTAYDYKNGIALVEKDGLFGVLDKEGEILIPLEYTNISENINGYFTAYKEGKIYVFSEDGELLNLENKYSNVGSYSDGYFIVSKIKSDGKIIFGYIDENGKEVIEPEYDIAFDFIDGKAVVKKGKEFKLISKKNNIKKTMNYKEIKPTENGYYIYSKKGEGYGVLDKEGNIILEDKYSTVLNVEDDIVLIGEMIDGVELFGAIDFKNKQIIPTKYYDIKHIGEGLIAVSDEIDIMGKKLYQILNAKGVPVIGDKFYKVTGKTGKNIERLISVSNDDETFFINGDGIIQNNLPIIDGYGELDYDGEIIKAMIDGELTYYNKDHQIIWKANHTFALENGREIIQKKYQEDRQLLIDYPVFVGFSDRVVQENINEALSEKFLKLDETGETIKKDDFKYYKTTYEVSNGGDFVSIEKMSEMIKIDNKKENLNKVVYNIDLDTGEIYELKDIFKVDSGYLNRLNQIVDDIVSNIVSEENRRIRAVKYNDSFKIEDGYLFLYLSYDEAKEYDGKGYEEIQINIDEIKDLLDRNNRLVENKIFNNE